MEGLSQKPMLVDTSAIIAEIREEPGAETVRRILAEPRGGGFYIHAVNVCEVAYKLATFGFIDYVAYKLATPRGINVLDRIQPPLWKRAASLKAAHQNLSLGDCILIAQAEALNADILTGDRAFQLVDTTAKVLLFR